jgi:dTDP-glucose pyrophosphorylase
MNRSFNNLIIDENTSLAQALEHMDKVRHKLLNVSNSEGKFAGLITIGDIQRAIISGNSLQSPVKNFIREDLVVAKTDDNKEEIKELMLKLRTEFMPVIDSQNNLVNILFWEDIIPSKFKSFTPLNIPVVIMAGGFGTRLRPLTYIIPKPLLPYGNKSILENIIEKFLDYSCNQFLLSVNYKAEMIKFYLDNLHDKRFTFELFTEDQPQGTAGSLSLLRGKINSPFFVSNCDILIDQDYAAIYEYHKKAKNELTVVVSVKNYRIPYGTIESGENGELLAIKEKPDLPFMINCGMYILEPHLLEEIPQNTFFHLTDLIEKIKQRGGRVGVFPISEKSMIDIGEWELYMQLLNKSHSAQSTTV